MPSTHDTTVADLSIGQSGEIVQVCDQLPERLRYLADLGLVPGANVTVVASAPFDGPVTVQVGDAVHPLDRRLAREIYILDPEASE
jgi:DtxR family Mn-dependent transcriptional regulator